MELDLQVSPEEIMSREVELGCESWTPPPPSPSLISHLASVDVKQNVPSLIRNESIEMYIWCITTYTNVCVFRASNAHSTRVLALRT